MNPPPALVAAFVARLDRVLDHMRAELLPGDVLVYRAPSWTLTPGELAPLPPDEQRYTLECGRMPVPLTVAEALATVHAARDDLAAAFAAELTHAVAVLVPAEYQAGALEDPAVLAAWPVRVAGFPGGGWRADVSPAGPVEALSHLLARVPTLPGEPEAAPVRPGSVRATLPAVAAWARPAHLAGVYLPPPTRWGGITTNYDPPPRVPAVGLTAIYRHLWARSPLFAACEAGGQVRELTASPDPAPAYLAAVLDALGSYARPVEGDPDALASAALEDTPDARKRLSGYAVSLLDAAYRVAPLFAVDPVAEDAARATVETSNGPALRWDAELAALLTARGDTVRGLAAGRWAAVYGPQMPILDTPRPAPGSLWALWAARDDGPPRWLLWLAADLWVSVWRPAAERERAKPPAVWGVLFKLLDRVHRPGGRIVEGVLIDRNGARVLDVRRDEPLPVVLVHREALGMLVRDGAGMLGSLNAHRFTRWALPTAHARALNGEPDARVLRADGGWTGLAKLVGAPSKKAPGELRAIVSALAHLWFPLPHGRGGNLLTYTESAAAGNWRSCVDITLGTALLPHYVSGLPRGTDRDLVPLPPLPPFVGRPNEHGAQAAMQLGTMAHLRTRAAELVRDGGVLVTPDQWAELAKTHGLPADMLAAVLDRWTHNGDDGPAFLEALGGGQYRIAAAHAAVHAFLLEAGRMEVNGAALAKRSSASKRKRLRLDR